MSDDYNPFEPDETPEQQNARIGRMIRENVDKRLAAERAAPATPATTPLGSVKSGLREIKFSDRESWLVHHFEEFIAAVAECHEHKSRDCNCQMCEDIWLAKWSITASEPAAATPAATPMAGRAKRKCEVCQSLGHTTLQHGEARGYSHSVIPAATPLLVDPSVERSMATARLKEAQWWHPGHFKPVPENTPPYPSGFHYIGCKCMACGRIEELERAVAMNSEAPQKLPAAAQPQRESEQP